MLKSNKMQKKNLKEYCDIDYIEPPCKEKAVCVTFNQPFA